MRDGVEVGIGIDFWAVEEGSVGYVVVGERDRDVVLEIADIDGKGEKPRVIELEVVAWVPGRCVYVDGMCAVAVGGAVCGGKVLFRWMNDDSVLGDRLVSETDWVL